MRCYLYHSSQCDDRRSNPETCCVVSIHSICMFEEVSTDTTERLPQTLSVTSPSPANLSPTLPNEQVLQKSSEKDRHSAYSRTSIVEEIIKRVIDPTVANIPCNSRQCGMHDIILPKTSNNN